MKAGRLSLLLHASDDNGVGIGFDQQHSFAILTTTKLKFNVLDPEGVIWAVPVQSESSVYVRINDPLD